VAKFACHSTSSSFIVLLRIFNLENISPVGLSELVAIWGFCTTNTHEGMHISLCSLQTIHLLCNLFLALHTVMFAHTLKVPLDPPSRVYDSMCDAGIFCYGKALLQQKWFDQCAYNFSPFSYSFFLR
ncbi:hypothetical protein V8G54_015098, partial [Vigna mungo]